MSIFGELDAATIPTNPYWVEKGEYSAEVTNAQFKVNRDGVRQLIIEYTINNEDSQFLDSKVFQFFNLVDADMTNEKMALLPAEEQKIIRRTMSALKRTLCGNDSNPSQKGLGVDFNDLNDSNWSPESLIGKKVDIGVNNYGPTNEGVTIRWVNLA